MADVERATFFEGQVVGAADLNHTVAYGRDALARHQRSQHLWGIVTGLELAGEKRTTPGGDPYVDVAAAPGLAIDGTGRAIVVVEEARLSDALFDQLNVAIADPEAYYPVFLEGRDREATGGAVAAVGRCERGGATRIAEGWEITFGRSGDELDLDLQQTIEVGDGAGAGGWRILLGFVQWDAALARFKAVKDEVEGVGRRYAGVRAGEVQGAGGKLVLRSGARNEDGAPALEITSADDGLLAFGPQDASGRVTPVLKVDTAGNLEVTGKIVGALAGGVQVESGVATDGMLLPLPAGIKQKAVDDGKVVLQVHVTPRYQEVTLTPAPPAGERWLPTPIECRVEGRRVFSRVRWRRTGAAPPPDQERSGACDYTLMAFPAGDEEGG